MKCWDQTTIYPGLLFNPTSPATGQCEPTVCLVQDIFGGDIYKITGDKSIAPKKTHYYNRLFFASICNIFIFISFYSL